MVGKKGRGRERGGEELGIYLGCGWMVVYYGLGGWWREDDGCVRGLDDKGYKV
jgi:hypothetical protein